MNSTVENLATGSTDPGNGVECVASTRTYHYAEMSVNTVSAAINLFLCFSLILYRRKLRQHLVNLYAANLVFANFALIAVVTVISYLEYFGFSRQAEYSKSIPASILYFWFTLKVCTYVMFLVICGGIGLLIIAMKKNMFRVHRTVAGLSRNSVETLKPNDKATDKRKLQVLYRLRHWVKKNPKKVAYIQIAFAWLLPIAFSTIVYHDGAVCIRKCYCLMNFIPTARTSPACPKDSGCNLLLPSLNNVALLMGFAIWVISVLILIALFVHSFVNFRQVLSEREKAKDAQARDNVLEPTNGEVYKENSTEVTLDQDVSGKLSISGENSTSLHQQNSIRTLERVGANFSLHYYPKTLLSESLKKNLTHLFIIALIFMLGTSPFVITTFLSVFIDFTTLYHDGFIQIPTNIIPVLSTILNSLLLCGSHFGLNVAVISMVRTIMQCHCMVKQRYDSTHT